LAKSVQAVIDPQSGLTAAFISSEDLIAAKRTAGRPQDLADVAALLKAAHVREAPTAKRKLDFAILNWPTLII